MIRNTAYSFPCEQRNFKTEFYVEPISSLTVRTKYLHERKRGVTLLFGHASKYSRSRNLSDLDRLQP